MDELKKPYAVIRFDESTGQLKRPTFLLKTRTGHIIGKLNYTSLNMSLVGKGVDEITFEVHKTVNGIECPFWDKIRDLGIVEFVEYDHSQFEADIRTDDEVDTIKYFTLKSLECELGQKKLYEFHVNDEDAIIYSTENPFIPTVLYNASDPEHSLIHRALKEKAPHWNVGEVSPYFNINGQVYSCDNLQREYTIDGTTIYDFFEGDVSEESCCVFTYNTKDRLVNCYNLEPCVFLKSNMQAQNGYTYIDGIFYDEAGNELDSNLYGWCDGIGEDTNIILSKTKLSRSFTRDSDAGSIKNCFRVTGGDDIITNTVGAANVTGNNYIYMFGNFQYEDMGEELTNLIKDYQTFYKTEQENFIKNGGVYIYHPEYVYDNTYDVCKDENGHILPDAEHIGNKVYVVDPCAYFKDNKCFSRDDVQLSSSNAYYKEPGMYTDYCHTLDRLAYLEHNKFPNTDVLSKTSASQQRDILQSYFRSNPVLVKYGYNPETDSDFRSITSTVETMLKLECDPRYTVSIIEDRDHVTTCTKVDENTQGIWSGTIRIVRDTDVKDKVDDFNLSITVKYVNSEDNLDYCKQKVLIAINKLDLKELGFTKTSTDHSSIGVITVITDNELRDLLNQYNLTTLKTFRDGFSSCRSTLDDLYNNLEIDAYKRDENGDIIRDENGNPIETDIISESLLVSRDAYTRRYQIACEIYDKRQTQVDEWTSLEQSQNANLIEYKKSMSLQYYFIYELLPNDIKSNIKYKDYGYPELNTSYYSSIAVGDLYLDIENGVVYKVKSISSPSIIWEEYYTSSGYQCWLDYNKYVREDEYNNGNYISDGLSDSEILLKAKELLEVANAELSKACNIQYKISGNLNNIFAENELKKLYSKFALFNYVRAKVDDQIYKLRLIEIRFNEDSPDQLEVVFSEQIEDVTGKLNDTASILAQSQSMGTTYSSTAKQAKQGVSAYRTFDNIRQEGMDSSLYLIKNSPEQLMTFERNGLLGRSMFDEGIYSPEQSIFTSNGLYFTRNGFESIETALGKFKYNNKWVYGLNAEYVIGKFMVGENLLITNENGSVNITGDGIELDGGTIRWKNHKLSEDDVEGLTDDLSKINSTIIDITDDIKQLDGRIQTYSQSTLPSTSWTTTEEKDKHINDVWLNTATSSFTVGGVTYYPGETYVYTKSGNNYSWVITQDSILKGLAMSNATIFTTKPNKLNDVGYLYCKGDLWILGADTTVNSVAYKKDTILTATADNTTTTFKDSDWIPVTTKAATDFASDSIITPGEKIQLKYTILEIDKEYDTISAQAGKYTVEITAYTTAYNALKTYINPILNTPNDNSDVVPATYQTKFSDYYTARKNAESSIETARQDYSDGVLETWVTNAFTPYQTNIQVQIDGKIQSYYQANAPYANKTNVDATSALDALTGDLWYETRTGKTYIYRKTTGSTSGKYNYTWTFEDVPIAVFDRIDGRKAIFLSAPLTDSDGDGYLYRSGDIWIISSADQSSSNTTVKNFAKQYTINTILASSVNKTVSQSFDTGDWTLLTTESAEQALSDIADMCNDGKLTGVEKIQTTRRLAEIDDEKAIYQAKKNAYSSNTSVTTAWSTYESKYNALKTQSANWALNSTTTTDITTASFTNYFTAYYSAKETLDAALEAASKKYAEDQAGAVQDNLTSFKSKVQGALMGNTTTEIGNDYVIAPMIGGGYLYIKNPNDGRSVTIDPQHNMWDLGAYANITVLKCYGDPANTYDPNQQGSNAYALDISNGKIYKNSRVSATSYGWVYQETLSRSNDYIFKITNTSGVTTIGADSDGNATFSGSITVGDTPSASTTGFTVNSSGLLKASNATIYGTIYATNGEFAGELKAATGEFSGKITASSGSIGGWDINDYYLTKNDQTWSIFQTVGMTMYSLTANASATLKPAYSENSIGSSGQLIFNTSYEYKKSGTKVGEAGYESTLTNASLIFTGHYNYDWINKESTPDLDYTAKYTSNEVEFTTWNGNIVSYTANGISCQGTSILEISGQTIPCLRNCYIDSGSVSAANLFSTSKAEFSGLDDYCQLRISCGSTGVMLRNDGNDFYFLVGETSGGWNNLRPFHFNLSTGNVTMENNVYVTNSNEAQYNLINTSVNRTGRLVMTSTQGGRFGLYVDGTGWIVRNDAYTSNIVYFDNYINSQRCVDASTTAIPNCYIDINGTFLRTSGSSKRYKKDIKTNIPDEIKPERLYDINVYSYKFRKDYLKNENDIRYQKDVVGFIAEDILEKYPIAAEYHKDNNGELIADDWNDRYIIPPMLKLIQDQKQEIDELKKQINEIKDLLMSR